LDLHSTTEPWSGSDRVEYVYLKRFEIPSHFTVEWSRDLDPVAIAPRFCS